MGVLHGLTCNQANRTLQKEEKEVNTVLSICFTDPPHRLGLQLISASSCVLGPRLDSELPKHQGQRGKLGLLYRQGDGARRG